jgi:hypothetical protein
LISIFSLPLAIDEFVYAVDTQYDISFAMNKHREPGLRLVLTSGVLPQPATAYGREALRANRSGYEEKHGP